MAVKKRVAMGTFAVGIFDWFCRYETVRGYVSQATSVGFAAFLSHWWVSPLLVTLGIVLYFWDKWNHVENQVSPPPITKQEIKDSGNSTATGGNATARIGDIHIHPSIPTQSQPLSVIPKPIPGWKKPASLVIRKPRRVWLRVDLEEVWQLSSNVNKMSAQGMVLPIYHDPKQTPTEARVYALRVHLVFTEKETQEETIIQAAYWVGYTNNSLDLAIGEYGEVILFVIAQGDPPHPLALSNANGGSNYNYSTDRLKFEPLKIADYSVQVFLIWGGEGQFKHEDALTISKEELKAMLPS